MRSIALCIPDISSDTVNMYNVKKQKNINNLKLNSSQLLFSLDKTNYSINRNLIIFILLFIFGSSLTVAQNFQATVNRNTVGKGDRIQITFSLQNAQGNNFKAPSFKGFTVLSGPSQQQSTSFVNGQMSSSMSYVYVVQADMEGKFTIEPAFINVNGKRLQSNTLSIAVTKGSPQQQTQSTDEKTLSKQADDVIRKNIFIRVSFSKQDAYQGEQIVATYKLFVHPELNVLSLGNVKMPTFNGFWTQDFDNKDMKWSQEILEGVSYKVAEIKKVVLLPQQSGTLSIEPLEIDAVVRLMVQNQNKRNRDPFDDFFNDPFFNRGNFKDFPYKVKSRAEKISIKALPPNAPVDFKGGVGNLQLRAWLDKTSTRENEPVTLKVQISGVGNLKLLEPFTLNLPPDIDSYDPKVADNVSVTTSGMTGNKTFEYYLIPRHEGQYKIEPIKFAYFDLAQKKYITLSSDQFTLKVDKGNGQEGTSIISGVNKEDVKLIGKDIRFIKFKSSTFSGRTDTFYGSLSFYLLSTLPLCLFLLFFIYQKRQEKLHGNQVLLKNRKANSIARKRLSTAKKLLTSTNEEKFLEEISKALWGYTSDKLSIPYSELTKDAVNVSLTIKDISEDTIKRLLQTIDYCEFARFAPASQKMEKSLVYNQAADVITELEGLLR